MELFNILFVVFIIALVVIVIILANENQRLKNNIEKQNKALKGMNEINEKQSLIIHNYEEEK